MVCFVVVSLSFHLIQCVCVSVFQWVSVSEEEYLPTTQTLFLNEKHTHTKQTHRRTLGRFLTPWDTFESRRIGAPGESERKRGESEREKLERNKNRASFISYMNDMMETCFSSSGSCCSRLRKQGCNASRITTGNTSRCLMVLLFLSVRYAPAYYTHTQKPSNFSFSYFYYIRNKFVASPARVFWFSNTLTHTHTWEGSI